MQEAHEYEPLYDSKTQIRLLKLRSAPHDHIIKCDIDTFDLASAPPFVALSYTWGPPSHTASVYINDRLLKIRWNLYNFLRAYRNDPYNAQHVWVDQICIAQADVRERSDQVDLMSNIYTRCLATITWLGPDVRDLALRLANTSHLPMPASLKHEIAIEIFRHEYFSRLWIIQELLLPPIVHVLCGDVWLTFNELLRSYGDGPPAVYLPSPEKTRRWDLEAAEGHTVLEHHNDIISAYRDPRRTISLYQCVTSFACHECDDDRDRIYGLLGLVPEEQRLVVDYNNETEEVFLDVLTALMKSGEWEFTDHWITHSRQAMKLSEYMGLNDQRPAIIALLADMSDIGRIDEAQGETKQRSTRLPSTLSMGFTPGPSDDMHAWWYNYRDDLYVRNNKNCGEPLDRVHCGQGRFSRSQPPPRPVLERGYTPLKRPS